ncbi:unnamed protein product [Musa acuminata subsp. malaccensis]|uniref:Complex III subunit VI n=1 Tax=Musa acuminata subsp. malaccensis TaxID=214687 RepID=A0A804KQH7_MUSAM|nr:unnamed protein product [Musa acuminata subsp. malaccensis]
MVIYFAFELSNYFAQRRYFLSMRFHITVCLNFRSDREPIDTKQYLEETCKPKCVCPLHAYHPCVERIKEDETGHKHCTGQYFDYWMCIDNCVVPKVFDKPK